MNENPNPFSDGSPASRRADIRRQLAIAAVSLIAIGVGVWLWMAFHQKTQTLDRISRELDSFRAAAIRSQTEAAELANKLTASLSTASELKDKLARSVSSVTELREKLSSNQSRIADLEKEKETVVQTHKGLEEEMRAALESKDVTISQLQGKLTVNILDRILFDSGEAVLQSAGEAVLLKIAAILEQHPTLNIHVIGHTDNVPIRASSRSRFTSNWELSTARALAAVRFLTEKAGVDPRRLGAVGYGEFRPIADNSTAEGRGKNRRIAITILADELVGADTVPTVQASPLPATPTGPSEPEVLPAP